MRKTLSYRETLSRSDLPVPGRKRTDDLAERTRQFDTPNVHRYLTDLSSGGLSEKR